MIKGLTYKQDKTRGHYPSLAQKSSPHSLTQPN